VDVRQWDQQDILDAPPPCLDEEEFALVRERYQDDDSSHTIFSTAPQLVHVLLLAISFLSIVAFRLNVRKDQLAAR